MNRSPSSFAPRPGGRSAPGPGSLGTADSAAPRRDRWLLSYADFVTLLLALFVLLYASQRLDAEQAEEVVAGLQRAFPIAAATSARRDSMTAPPAAIVGPPLGAEEALGGGLREHIAAIIEVPKGRAHPSVSGTRLREDDRGLVIELAVSEFFPAGGAELAPEKIEILADLAPVLMSSGRHLQFEGHTDDQPTRSSRFPSNWELSAARAASLARYFIEEQGLDPTWVATTGYAAYRPLVPNLGEAARAQNRRVEIVLLNPPAANTERRRPIEARLESLGRMLDALPPLPE